MAIYNENGTDVTLYVQDILNEEIMKKLARKINGLL